MTIIPDFLTANFIPARPLIVPTAIVGPMSPLAIVIHVTGAPTAQSTLYWFANPKSEVSAHYLIDIDGSRIWHLVRDMDTAWHVGITYPELIALRKARPDLPWLLAAGNPNAMTIGIEHVGLGGPFPDAQMQASAELIRQLCGTWQIPIDRKHIVGHHEIYSGHACPGECDLDKLVEMAAVAV